MLLLLLQTDLQQPRCDGGPAGGDGPAAVGSTAQRGHQDPHQHGRRQEEMSEREEENMEKQKKTHPPFV